MLLDMAELLHIFYIIQIKGFTIVYYNDARIKSGKAVYECILGNCETAYIN